jgi:hypothetical protein
MGWNQYPTGIWSRRRTTKWLSEADSAVRTHYSGEAAAAEGTGSSCSAPLTAWVVRLWKSLASTSSDLQDWAVCVISPPSVAHIKSVLGSQVIHQSEIYFVYPVWIERNQPLHFGLLCFWEEPFRLFS